MHLGLTCRSEDNAVETGTPFFRNSVEIADQLLRSDRFLALTLDQPHTVLDRSGNRSIITVIGQIDSGVNLRSDFDTTCVEAGIGAARPVASSLRQFRKS